MKRIRTLFGNRTRTNWTRIGAIGLVLAGLMVALAIVTNGVVSRGINGVGAMIWMLSLAALLMGIRDELRWRTMLALAVLVTLVLSFGVEPTNIATAVPGFAIGGAAIAFVSRRPATWALIVPALWLPVHLLTAVVPAIVRSASGGEASVRTDPPPTAAVVPLLMIVSAGVAGWLVGRWREHRGAENPVASSRS